MQTAWYHVSFYISKRGWENQWQLTMLILRFTANGKEWFELNRENGRHLAGYTEPPGRALQHMRWIRWQIFATPESEFCGIASKIISNTKMQVAMHCSSDQKMQIGKHLNQGKRFGTVTWQWRSHCLEICCATRVKRQESSRNSQTTASKQPLFPKNQKWHRSCNRIFFGRHSTLWWNHMYALRQWWRVYFSEI